MSSEDTCMRHKIRLDRPPASHLRPNNRRDLHGNQIAAHAANTLQVVMLRRCEPLPVDESEKELMNLLTRIRTSHQFISKSQEVLSRLLL